ncbi:hypothetical protein [Sphingomonas sp. MA1305]|nr:hypothetical protein [Sphingomonas sp. MA1305]
MAGASTAAAGRTSFTGTGAAAYGLAATVATAGGSMATTGGGVTLGS